MAGHSAKLTPGILAVALGLAGAAHAQGRPNTQQAGLELGYRAPQVVARMGLTPGSTVAAFGVSDMHLLRSIVEAVGDSGRVHAITRNERTYVAVRTSIVPDYGWRLDAIFAADGDAHLEVDLADAVVVVDNEGFVFQRPEDLFRQVRTILRTGGKLILLRLASRVPESGRVRPEKGARRTAIDSGRGPSAAERLALERYGLFLVEVPDILQHREMWIFERREAP